MPQKPCDKNVHGTFILCKCPRCDAFYRRRLLWIGRGVPRVNCPGCLEDMQRRSSAEDDRYAYHRYAAGTTGRFGGIAF